MSARLAENKLFKSVPSHGYLGLLKEGGSPKNTADFLEFDRSDVARAIGISEASVRYDERMPKELEQRLREIAVICELVAEHFNGDTKKTALWFQVSNPTLGNISPRDMIRLGRYQKLLKFIQNALTGNIA